MTPPAHLLSFDIEEHWRSYQSRGIAADLPHDHDLAVLDRILALLADTGSRATFFVLASFAEREPSVVRRIAAAGQEVASHGYAHIDLTRHTPESFRADAHKAKGILEDQAGRPVLGHRAAQWSLTPATAWALPILADLGHAYDSSAFPGRIHRYGWPGLPTAPHRRDCGGGASIIEFPASRLGCGSLSTQACGGFYWRALPGFLHAWAAGRQGCWYFHAYDLDPNYPLPPDLPWKVRLLKRFRTASAFARLQRLLCTRRFIGHGDALPLVAD